MHSGQTYPGIYILECLDAQSVRTSKLCTQFRSVPCRERFFTLVDPTSRQIRKLTSPNTLHYTISSLIDTQKIHSVTQYIRYITNILLKGVHPLGKHHLFLFLWTRNNILLTWTLQIISSLVLVNLLQFSVWGKWVLKTIPLIHWNSHVSGNPSSFIHLQSTRRHRSSCILLRHFETANTYLLHTVTWVLIKF